MIKAVPFSLRAIVAAAAVAIVTPAVAGTPAPAVVELFTSQSCSSCPPAEAFLGELAGRPDVVALEFHVDYWDDLVYGRAGRWQDVFSDPAHTARQRAYNARLFGEPRAYTPQMVIDGRTQATGFRRGDVEAAIRDRNGADRPTLTVVATDDAKLAIAIGGRAAAADVWLVRFVKARTTVIARGENHGKTLTNHHAVTAVERVAEWRGGEMSLAVLPGLGAGEGCAVLVQETGQGPILAARYCP